MLNTNVNPPISSACCLLSELIRSVSCCSWACNVATYSSFSAARAIRAVIIRFSATLLSVSRVLPSVLVLSSTTPSGDGSEVDASGLVLAVSVSDAGNCMELSDCIRSRPCGRSTGESRFCFSDFDRVCRTFSTSGSDSGFRPLNDSHSCSLRRKSCDSPSAERASEPELTDSSVTSSFSFIFSSRCLSFSIFCSYTIGGSTVNRGHMVNRNRVCGIGLLRQSQIVAQVCYH